MCSRDDGMIPAVEVILAHTALHPVFQGRDRGELILLALTYLRIRAAKGNVEAKVKLSTVLLDEGPCQDEREAEIWARSVFDRRLSVALGACVPDLEKHRTFGLFDAMLRTGGHDELAASSANLCHLMGLTLIDGVGIEPDVKRGVRFLQRAADAGHESAGVELAAILGDAYKYPAVYDLRQSVVLYETATSINNSDRSPRRLTSADARALSDLARLYYEGDDTSLPRDLEKAYRYARRVAETTGEQYCQYIVGDILLNREQDPSSNSNDNGKDAREAVFWLTQSGEQGFPLAVETLSRIYFLGFSNHIKRDYEQAHEWCIKGDELWPSGLGFCQMCLGDMYRSGLGVPRDLMRSFEYYQKAASQQDAPQNYARFMLGEMARAGLKTTRLHPNTTNSQQQKTTNPH
ncbi:hypothetical protein BX666DRAFT_765914 [Dichotomocladium elegans]|nr:hypothetical protein BX666DRAFT_765914 [Dichotomocladium elegans]